MFYIPKTLINFADNIAGGREQYTSMYLYKYIKYPILIPPSSPYAFSLFLYYGLNTFSGSLIYLRTPQMKGPKVPDLGEGSRTEHQKHYREVIQACLNLGGHISSVNFVVR